jgi:hypothetical protein
MTDILFDFLDLFVCRYTKGAINCAAALIPEFSAPDLVRMCIADLAVS